MILLLTFMFWFAAIALSIFEFYASEDRNPGKSVLIQRGMNSNLFKLKFKDSRAARPRSFVTSVAETPMLRQWG